MMCAFITTRVKSVQLSARNRWTKQYFFQFSPCLSLLIISHKAEQELQGEDMAIVYTYTATLK